MTLETLFLTLFEYRLPIAYLVLAAPWVTYLLCQLIPGQREEPFLLSLNLSLAVFGMMILTGYLAYATHTGGWRQVVQQADVVLLFLPIYHVLVSLWLSKRRLPLHQIPAFRTLQGMLWMAIGFLILSKILGRLHIILFSYIPFSTFLLILAVIVGIMYAGYRKVTG